MVEALDETKEKIDDVFERHANQVVLQSFLPITIAWGIVYLLTVVQQKQTQLQTRLWFAISYILTQISQISCCYHFLSLASVIGITVSFNSDNEVYMVLLYGCLLVARCMLVLQRAWLNGLVIGLLTCLSYFISFIVIHYYHQFSDGWIHDLYIVCLPTLSWIIFDVVIVQTAHCLYWQETDYKHIRWILPLVARIAVYRFYVSSQIPLAGTFWFQLAGTVAMVTYENLTHARPLTDHITEHLIATWIAESTLPQIGICFVLDIVVHSLFVSEATTTAQSKNYTTISILQILATIAFVLAVSS